MLWHVRVPFAVVAAAVILALPACTVSGAAGSVDQLRVGRGAGACPVPVPVPAPVELYRETPEGRQYVSLLNIVHPEAVYPPPLTGCSD